MERQSDRMPTKYIREGLINSPVATFFGLSQTDNEIGCMRPVACGRRELPVPGNNDAAEDARALLVSFGCQSGRWGRLRTWLIYFLVRYTAIMTHDSL